MNEVKLSVPNIGCDHCVNRIKQSLSEIDGLKEIEPNMDLKEITVRWAPPATIDRILSVLEEIGYPPQAQ